VEYSTFTKKSANITPNNIGSLMLCQIPGIHSTTAEAIMKKFGTIENIILQLRENPDCLQELSYVTNKGQTRKISKTVLENIKIYLVSKSATEENIIL
jgi:ERCC4-type nuclease